MVNKISNVQRLKKQLAKEGVEVKGKRLRKFQQNHDLTRKDIKVAVDVAKKNPAITSREIKQEMKAARVEQSSPQPESVSSSPQQQIYDEESLFEQTPETPDQEEEINESNWDQVLLHPDNEERLDYIFSLNGSGSNLGTLRSYETLKDNYLGWMHFDTDYSSIWRPDNQNVYLTNQGHIANEGYTNIFSNSGTTNLFSDFFKDTFSRMFGVSE